MEDNNLEEFEGFCVQCGYVGSPNEEDDELQLFGDGDITEAVLMHPSCADEVSYFAELISKNKVTGKEADNLMEYLGVNPLVLELSKPAPESLEDK